MILTEGQFSIRTRKFPKSTRIEDELRNGLDEWGRDTATVDQFQLRGREARLGLLVAEESVLKNCRQMASQLQGQRGNTSLGVCWDGCSWI
jgi:hypothetical protein